MNSRHTFSLEQIGAVGIISLNNLLRLLTLRPTARLSCMNRRHFLAAAAASSAFIVRAEEPIDSLPRTFANSVHNGFACFVIRRRCGFRASLTDVDKRAWRTLVVSGQVFAPDGSRAVSGVTVYAYTRRSGHYTENHKLYPPRLYG